MQKLGVAALIWDKFYSRREIWGHAGLHDSSQHLFVHSLRESFVRSFVTKTKGLSLQIGEHKFQMHRIIRLLYRTHESFIENLSHEVGKKVMCIFEIISRNSP